MDDFKAAAGAPHSSLRRPTEEYLLDREAARVGGSGAAPVVVLPGPAKLPCP